MTDFQGTEIKVGDTVAYIRKTYCSAEMAVGKVVKIKGRLAYFDNRQLRGCASTSIYRLGGDECRIGKEC